jgi:hypothetical protein
MDISFPKRLCYYQKRLIFRPKEKKKDEMRREKER